MPLLELRHVSKSFKHAKGNLRVLEDVNFGIEEGEFIAIVGPSGSGKSTMLRIINGLIAPTAGQVLFKARQVDGINPECALVFQSFALLPWLTVKANVELGLEARGIPPAEREKRASIYIDKVGLDGFDEPFSALDALTAITLREELLDLWQSPDMPVHTIVIVTHVIEEAVELAGRIVVMSASPGRIAAEVQVDLARPRDRRQEAFNALTDKVFSLIEERA
jgi:NitT/TauT family transport system ATP-binding protein